MRFTIQLLLLFSIHGLAAQNKTIPLSFNPSYDNAPLVLEHFYKTQTGDSLQIETLKFYISQVELYAGDALVFSEKNSFHLIDATDKTSQNLRLDVPAGLEYSHIKFNVGIDSLTNVSGAMEGDLDPTKGMYWTWQSGYINFKLEGTASHCPARHQLFQFHIGGYLRPYSPLQTVLLKVDDVKKVQIQVAIDAFLDNINLTEQYEVMSPNEEAVDLSEALPAIFSIKN